MSPDLFSISLIRDDEFGDDKARDMLSATLFSMTAMVEAAL
jgi:hypothetical protein